MARELCGSPCLPCMLFWRPGLLLQQLPANLDHRCFLHACNVHACMQEVPMFAESSGGGSVCAADSGWHSWVKQRPPTFFQLTCTPNVVCGTSRLHAYGGDFC